MIKDIVGVINSYIPIFMSIHYTMDTFLSIITTGNSLDLIGKVGCSIWIYPDKKITGKKKYKKIQNKFY